MCNNTPFDIFDHTSDFYRKDHFGKLRTDGSQKPDAGGKA
jgi:hypothetical protein